MAKINVVVPVYRVEQYLRRCIDSILEQSFADFQLILVDDGSPDSCGTICDQYAKIDNRIVVIHQDNGGLSAARNAGIDWCFSNNAGEWITFIDSDDWIHPRYLDYLIASAEKNNVSVVVGAFVRTSSDCIAFEQDAYKCDILKTTDFYCGSNDNFIVAWGKLYRLSDFVNIRYPVGKLHEDEFTTWKILFRYSEVAFISTPLYAYFQNDGGIMRTKWSLRRLDHLDAVDERLKWLRKNKIDNRVLEYTIDCQRVELMYGILNIAEYCPEEGKKKAKLLQARFRFFLLKYLKKYPVSAYSRYYEIAYPFSMKVYWKIWNFLEKRR